jgi:hypothetical protein
MPFDNAIAAFYQARKKLHQDYVFDLWETVKPRVDRLAGLLCLSELRMPHLPVFGELKLSQGNLLTDYDRARQFLLKEYNGNGPLRDYYPEVRILRHLGVREQVMALASSHVGCLPKNTRQVNLFGLCCMRNLKDAADSTTPSPGTTCGLFMRAVLRAVGNTWLTRENLPTQAHMLKAMGIGSDKDAAYINTTVPSRVTSWPKRGDMYLVIRPSVAAPLPNAEKKADSGHVGFVTSAAVQNGDQLSFDSIDGGTERSGADGFHTISQRQSFAKGSRGFYYQRNKEPRDGENRILAGFVDLDRIASHFIRNWSASLDGREIDTVYQSMV